MKLRKSIATVPMQKLLTKMSNPPFCSVFLIVMRMLYAFLISVKWLCHSAGVELNKENLEVFNMRELSADEVCSGFLGGES